MKGEIWLGSEASAEGYVRYLEYIAANPIPTLEQKAQFRAWEDDDEEEQDRRFESYLIKEFNNVGVIEIKGGMTNKDDWRARFFGLTTYPEIIRAASELMADDGITAIVLDIDSGGGSASGIESVSRSLKAVNSIKPVYATTGGNMASAAYWIGATARKIYSTEMSQLGSIGVIATHLSMVGMLEEMGVEATVIRAGKYKAPGSQFEKLSERDQGILQKELDSLHGFFLNHVSKSRGLSLSSKSEWGEGQMFFGEEAVEIGLADKILSPEELIVSLEDTDAVDNQFSAANNSRNNTGDSQMSLENRREVILHSEEDRAAVAAGAPLENFDHEEVVAEEQEVEVEATAAPVETTTTTVTSAPQAGDDKVVARLVELSAQNAILQRELDEAKAKLSSSESVVESLADGLGAQINRMEIGLRRAETNFQGMSPAAVVAKYEATRKDFDAQFKVGRQTSQAMEEPTAQVARLGIVPVQSRG